MLTVSRLRPNTAPKIIKVQSKHSVNLSPDSPSDKGDLKGDRQTADGNAKRRRKYQDKRD